VDAAAASPLSTSVRKRSRPGGRTDAGVLAVAAGEDRILVSHDFQTMPRHFGDFLQVRGSSPGMILVPQHMPIRKVIEELVLIWGASDPAEWKNRWQALPLPYRVR